eukprot:1161378-Pelagomonas_calceolata.AAC.3
MVHRTHAALTLTEQGAPSRPDPSSASTATSPLDASGDTELGVDAHSQLRTLLAVFATCKTYEFFPPPLQLAVFMARIEVSQPGSQNFLTDGLLVKAGKPSRHLLR